MGPLGFTDRDGDDFIALARAAIAGPRGQLCAVAVHRILKGKYPYVNLELKYFLCVLEGSMKARDIREVARLMASQFTDAPQPRTWGDADWEVAIAEFMALVVAESSALRLGDVLRYDAGLDLPVSIVKATYERLFRLGVDDIRTRLCYARYLLLHGPEWDSEARGILAEIEQKARVAGLWESNLLGHHPVFYAGPE